MEQHVRETWITAGRTIQAFTKINNAKMTDIRPQNTDGKLIKNLIRLLINVKINLNHILIDYLFYLRYETTNNTESNS